VNAFEAQLAERLSNRRETEHENVRVPRLPMMEINAEASDVLSAHVASCVHQLKQFFGLITTEELRVQNSVTQFIS
jgi:hypothetical protein